MPDTLSIWTVYDHPKDFPDKYVARRWEILPTGGVPTDDMVTASDLETLRNHFRDAGLYPLPREDGDDGVIVETWI